ncbi:MAG: hypothetical protein KBT01_04030, partial [Clostridiales bacterium]|nr:hypothetical protein [Candidatus Blautia equi]
MKIRRAGDREHLITDANGTAESTELYLGNYEIIQTEAPLYYVQNTKPYDVKLGKKNGKSSSQ